MTTPGEILRFPTLEDARIAPIESPSAGEMYSCYSDIVLDMMRIGELADDFTRRCASQALSTKFLENPEADYGSEIWLQGATALFTRDPVVLREVFENELGRPPEDTDELPDCIGFPLNGLEQIQGFFERFTTGPVLDIASDEERYLDFSFCVNIANPLITTPMTGISESPEFLVGDWLVVLGPDPNIGTVS